MRDTLSCVLNVLVSVALILLSMRYVVDFWMLAFVYSLQIHLAIACCIGVFLSLAIKRHWYTFMLLAWAVFLAGHGAFMLREFALPPAQAQSKTFRLMSFNILNSNYVNSDRLAEAIINSGADVVYTLESAPIFPHLGEITKVYPYRIGCGVDVDNCDLMIMSKRPFLTARNQTISGLWHNRFALVTIDLDGTKVNFAATQLSKPYFDDFHSNELWRLSGILRKIDGPLILAGDFNSAIIAPDMQFFARQTKLHNLYPEPSTWPIEAKDYGISIDHVLAREPLRLISVERLPNDLGSNHYGLIADFTLQP